jgi:hypothetical protein
LTTCPEPSETLTDYGLPVSARAGWSNFGKSIIRRRSAPSHAALLGDVGLGRIIQSIDLVRLLERRGGIALRSQMRKSSRGAFIHRKYENNATLEMTSHPA